MEETKNMSIRFKHLPVIGFAMSAAAHLSFFLGLPRSYREKSHFPKRSASAVAVFIKKLPLKKDELAVTQKIQVQTEKPSKQGLRSKTSREAVSKTKMSKSDAKPSPKISNYADLLPKGGDFEENNILPESNNSQGESKETFGGKGHGPYSGETYQNVMIESNILQGIFDIPLYLRQETDSASASLLVEPLDARQSKIILLKGSPYLRALIWECLKDEKTTTSLHQIALAMGEKILTIRLSYKSQMSSDPTAGRYTEDIRLAKGLVTIEIILNKNILFGPHNGGVSLPDKDAEFAKKVDRMHMSALTGSKAFQQALRNETVAN